MENIKVLIPENVIKKRVAALGKSISEYYADERVYAVCILKGAAVFMTDLVRQMQGDVVMDFMTVSSYGNATESSGNIEVKTDVSFDCKDKNVLIVEDIIDTGNTLYYIKDLFEKRGAASVKICTLIDKPSRRQKDVNADWKGIDVPDTFIVGYGLDYAQKYRNLPFIGELEFTD